MNRLLVTTAVGTLLALGTLPAMATDATNVLITQTVSAAQTALNTLSLVQNDDGPTTQKAINAANLVDFVGALGTINQSVGSVQSAGNSATTVWGHFWDTIQSATNVANSIQLTRDAALGINGDLHNITQTVGGTASQSATNLVQFQEQYDPAHSTAAPYKSAVQGQVAINAFNLVSVHDIDNTANQSTAPVTQFALNQILPAQPGVTIGLIEYANQVATNVSNSLEANEVGNILQAANGAQTAHNLIHFGDGPAPDMAYDNIVDLLNSTQAATNVGDIVTLARLDNSVQQSSTLNQSALNEAIHVGPGTQWTDGMVNNLKQDALNASNIVSTVALGNTASINQQYGIGSQTAQNILTTVGGLSGIVQNATNVANSFATPTP